MEDIAATFLSAIGHPVLGMMIGLTARFVTAG